MTPEYIKDIHLPVKLVDLFRNHYNVRFQRVPHLKAKQLYIPFRLVCVWHEIIHNKTIELPKPSRVYYTNSKNMDCMYRYVQK